MNASTTSTTTTPTPKRRRTQTDAQATQTVVVAMFAQVWSSLDNGAKGGWVQYAQQGNGESGNAIGVQPKTNAYLTFIKVNTAIYAVTGTVM